MLYVRTVIISLSPASDSYGNSYFKYIGLPDVFVRIPRWGKLTREKQFKSSEHLASAHKMLVLRWCTFLLSGVCAVVFWTSCYIMVSGVMLCPKSHILPSYIL